MTRSDDGQRELDLGDVKGIDQIVVWNRGEAGQAALLRDFRVHVLDADRKDVWQRQVAEPPQPIVTLWPVEAIEVPLDAEAAEHFRPTPRGEGPSGRSSGRRRGWFGAPNDGRPRVAVFALQEPLDARNKTLAFTIEHLSASGKAAIGRFRVSVTGEPTPVPVEPTVVEWR